MSANELSSVVGIIWSLLANYLPFINTWYESLEKAQKAASMGLLIIVTGLGAYGLGCAGIVEGIECTRTGFLGVVLVIKDALIANQGTHLVFKHFQTKSVKEAAAAK